MITTPIVTLRARFSKDFSDVGLSGSQSERRPSVPGVWSSARLRERVIPQACPVAVHVGHLRRGASTGRMPRACPVESHASLRQPNSPRARSVGFASRPGIVSADAVLAEHGAKPWDLSHFTRSQWLSPSTAGRASARHGRLDDSSAGCRCATVERCARQCNLRCTCVRGLETLTTHCRPAGRYLVSVPMRRNARNACSRSRKNSDNERHAGNGSPEFLRIRLPCTLSAYAGRQWHTRHRCTWLKYCWDFSHLRQTRGVAPSRTAQKSQKHGFLA